MARRSRHGALALPLAAVLATQPGCALLPLAFLRTPELPSGTVTPAAPGEPIACRAYRRWMTDQPQEASIGPWVAGALSAAALVGGVAAAATSTSCSECYAPSGGALAGALLLSVAATGAVTALVLAHNGEDPRARLVSRCDEQLALHCQGLDDAACRSALDGACAAGDAGACWAARLEGPVPRPVPTANLARPPCDPRTDPPCALDRSLDAHPTAQP